MSFICFRPLASISASTLPAVPFARVHSASNTWRAALLEIVPSAMRAISAASSAASTGLLDDSMPVGVQAARDLAHHPVGDQLGRRAGVARGLEVARRSRALCVIMRGVVAGAGRRRVWKRSAIARGSSGISRAHPLDPLGARSPAAAGRGRGSSGSRARLPWCASRASRRCRGRTARWPAAIVRPSSSSLDLPADLVVDRLLHEAEAVQVLDLAARAERLRRAGAPRRWRRSGS